MPAFVVENMVSYVRALGLIGLFVIGVVWDTATMTQTPRDFSREGDAGCFVKRSPKKTGFHRDITTTVMISEAMLKDIVDTEEPQILIEEHIPSGLYVDLYQTKAAEEFGGPQVYSEVDIDVENPEHLSPDHTVYVFSPLTLSDGQYDTTITLPVHLRYHRPSAESSHHTLHLQPPHIMIRVPERTETDNSNEYNKAVCDTSGRKLCTWKTLSCLFKPGDGSLQFDVPVGQESHVTMVTSITLSLTVLSTFFMAHSILTKKKNNQKKD